MHSSNQSKVNSKADAVAYPPVTADRSVGPRQLSNLVGNDNDDDINLAQVWAVLRRRWLPALLVFSTTSALVTIQGLRETPMYQAGGQLLFKTRDRTLDLTAISSANNVLQTSSQDIQNQIGVIKTQPIIDQVVEDLKQQNPKSNATFGLFLSRLGLVNDKGSNILSVTYRDPDPKQAQRAVDTLMAVYVQQQRQDNRAETTAAREFLEQQLPLAEAEANRASEALKQFKQQYQLLDLTAEIASTTTNLEANNQQITQLNSTLADTEARFNILASQIGRDPKTALALTALSQAEGVKQVLGQYQQVEMTLASERVRFQDSHPRMVDLNNQLESLRQILNQRVRAITGQTNQNNFLTNTNLQLGEIEAKLVGDYLSVDAQRQGLEQQLRVLVKAQVLKQKRASTLPQLEQQWQQLSRWVETAQSTYSLLLQRYQESRIAENQNVGNVRIIQPALAADKPVSPQKPRKVGTGVALGALLAALCVYILEKLDRTIKSVKEVEDSYGYPLLGTVPVYDTVLDADYKRQRSDAWQYNHPSPSGSTGLLTRELAQSQWAEAYHAIRTNLAFVGLRKQDGIKLLITSAMPNEGKSTVSINLATIYASMGKQVLIIDCDIRRPSQHKLWSVDNYTGLTDVLAGNATVGEALKQVTPGVDVLTAGTIPPNPVVLLEDEKLPALLDNLASQYNIVIMDTSPINAVIDPLILNRYVDGLLMVARPKVVTYETATLAKEKLRQAHCTVNGLIINGVPKSDSYYYYNYYDYYGEADN